MSPSQINTVKSSENLIVQTLLYSTTPLVQMFFQWSILTTAYPNIGFNSSHLILLVPVSSNCRPLSHHAILCRCHYSKFRSKWILLEMFLLCLVSLPLFTIHTYHLLCNIIRGACSGTTSVSLFSMSLCSILKCARDIPTVHDKLYSLSTLDWETGPGTCVQ